MATSESDDFESADEEMVARAAAKKSPQRTRAVVDSDSDDGQECFPQKKYTPRACENSLQRELQAASEKRGKTERISKQKKSGPRKLGKKVEKEDGEVPEELRSNLKFKDVFKDEGWEEIDEEKAFSEPNLGAEISENQGHGDNSWGGWGGWGVTSLINSATAGVSTLTSTVTQGLTLLEESIGTTNPAEPAQFEAIEPADTSGNDSSEKEGLKESQSQTSFVLGNLMSGVSSITNFVESTSTKVISGGLDTLEVIGKKTMQVLQEGDPGLKKKRAFFLNETEKPNLSFVLRDAKEKADTEEKSLEEKQLSRKVHFESLFDDFQGLVHLEALEMLSKQASMKIEQKLINVDGQDLISMQETLQEIRDLCDLEDEDEEEKTSDKELKERLSEACKDLGVSVNYDKLNDAQLDIQSFLASETAKSTTAHRQIFQQAISALAQFTAYSVERFHKSAELLLVKERRSTVNEADALVQLARILCSQIGNTANSFCDRLNEFQDDKSAINSSITTIFLEAANASSYIQDAFRLLIPILQVGAV